MTESFSEAAQFDLPHSTFEITPFTQIGNAARAADNNIDPALRQDRQCIDNYLVVLVQIELIGQIKEFHGQAVLLDNFKWNRSQKRRRWLSSEPNYGDLTSRPGIVLSIVAEGTFAAEHEAPARCNLDAKA